MTGKRFRNSTQRRGAGGDSLLAGSSPDRHGNDDFAESASQQINSADAIESD
jgi:hypothetical protein